MSLHATLTVDDTQGKVLVTFNVENRGERRVGLPKSIAAATEPAARLFDVRERPGDKAVPYTGAASLAAGRAAGDEAGGDGASRNEAGGNGAGSDDVPTVGDHFELAPHSAHTHTIDISRFYAFRPGTHTYVIRYEGAALTDVRQAGSLARFATEPVMFSHTAG